MPSLQDHERRIKAIEDYLGLNQKSEFPTKTFTGKPKITRPDPKDYVINAAVGPAAQELQDQFPRHLLRCLQIIPSEIDRNLGRGSADDVTGISSQ